jgi:hypothetical protein
MTKLFLVFTGIFFLCGCGQHADKIEKDTKKEGNKSTTISTDIVKLSGLIDIATYKPESVKFRYIFIDNSGKNERESVPGPSDSYLEAVLYFNNETFDQISKKYVNAAYPSLNFDRKDFNFEWLESTVKDELLKSDTLHHGHPDMLFKTGGNGKLWFLNNKILLKKFTM